MVPSGWEIKKLDNVFKVFDSLHKTPTFTDDGYAMVRVTDIKGGYLDLNNTIKVSPEVFAEFTKKYKPKASDIVFSRVGSYGISSYAATDTPFCLGQNTVIAESNSSADSLYIFNVLKGQYVKRQIERTVDGSSHKTVSLKIIRSLDIPIPPLPEQRKIAQILSTWDKAISTTERLIDNSKQQKKALMQQLLTGKKRLLDDSGKPFEGEWKQVHMEEACFVNPKKSAKPADGLVSFVPMDAVSEDTKLIRHELKRYDEVSKGFTSFENQDCLVAKITPCFENGKGAYVDNLHNGIGFGSTEFHVLRAREGNCTKFIYYISQTREFRVRGEMNMQGSAGQKRVTTDYLKLFKVNIPPTLVEQQKVASVLNNADQEIELLELQLADLKQEKKALMQQLLTGKRRVKIDDKEVA